MSSLLYIPCTSLTKEDIESLVKLSLSPDVGRVDTHGGRKATIKYLLNLRTIGFDLSSYIDSEELNKFEEVLNQLKEFDLFKKEFEGNQKFEPYWELTSDSSRIHPVAKNARQFNDEKSSFSPEQLKVYFNPAQINNIPFSNATFQSSGFVDGDAKDNMIKYPLNHRHNKGLINTKKCRIEQAIFDVPPNKQIIILDFADERMPGGLFSLF
jgi:hypothetical protein